MMHSASKRGLLVLAPKFQVEIRVYSLSQGWPTSQRLRANFNAVFPMGAAEILPENVSRGGQM